MRAGRKIISYREAGGSERVRIPLTDDDYTCTFQDGQIFNSLNGVIEFTETSRALMKISGRSGSCMIMK